MHFSDELKNTVHTESISPPLSASIREQVQKDFASGARSAVENELQKYGGKQHHRMIEEVRSAILELSDGSLEDVRHYTAQADEDWRDILFWVTEYHRPFQEILDRLVKRNQLTGEERHRINQPGGGEHRKLRRLLRLMHTRRIQPTKAEFELISKLAARVGVSEATVKGIGSEGG